MITGDKNSAEAWVDIKKRRRHGHSGSAWSGKMSPEYHSWANMIQRCTNPKNRGWKNYGGRGISVCERWRLFCNFIADMGEMPPKHEIDRIDNDGNYCPENCRWATRIEQAANMRRTRAFYYAGRKRSLMDIARIVGMPYMTLLNRIVRRGMDLESAINTPRVYVRKVHS